jgi:hypothetical protein
MERKRLIWHILIGLLAASLLANVILIAKQRSGPTTKGAQELDTYPIGWKVIASREVYFYPEAGIFQTRYYEPSSSTQHAKGGEAPRDRKYDLYYSSGITPAIRTRKDGRQEAYIVAISKYGDEEWFIADKKYVDVSKNADTRRP